MGDYTGGVAALIASLCFSVGSTMFTLAGRRFGPLLTLRVGQTIALPFVFVLHWLTIGQPFPVGIEPARWFWLGMSGVLGFGLAFMTMIHAFVRIGPRLALLIASLGPILSAILAWVFLDERLNTQSILGILLTIGGIAIVVREGSSDDRSASPQAFRIGVLFAAGSAVTQAASFVMSKYGISGDFEPLTATFMRLLVALAAIWFFTLLTGQMTGTVSRLREYPRAFRQLSVGAVSGPVIGASMVLVSLQHAPVGVASTLSNLTPILLIPIGYFVFKEHITRWAVYGTLVAMAGTAILFL